MTSPFMEALRADMRLRGYSIRTEKSYLHWVRRYIFFCNTHRNTHPKSIAFKTLNRQYSL